MLGFARSKFFLFLYNCLGWVLISIIVSNSFVCANLIAQNFVNSLRICTCHCIPGVEGGGIEFREMQMK